MISADTQYTKIMSNNYSLYMYVWLYHDWVAVATYYYHIIVVGYPVCFIQGVINYYPLSYQYHNIIINTLVAIILLVVVIAIWLQT